MKFENIHYNHREPASSNFGSKETKNRNDLPKSSLEMLNTFLDKLENVKKLFPSDSYLNYTNEFIKDLSRFIDSLKEYGESVENYNRLFNSMNQDRDLIKLESQEQNMQVELFRQQEFKRRTVHDIAMKNYVRLIDSYNEMFSTLSSHPLINKEDREKLRKERFPWKNNILLDEDGKIKEKFINEKNGIDLSHLNTEARETLSEWMLKLAGELQEAQNYDEQIKKHQEIKEEDLDQDPQQIIDLNIALHQLEEEKKAVEKYEQYKNSKI